MEIQRHAEVHWLDRGVDGEITGVRLTRQNVYIHKDGAAHIRHLGSLRPCAWVTKHGGWTTEGVRQLTTMGWEDLLMKLKRIPHGA